VTDDRTPLSLELLCFLAQAPEPLTLAEIVAGTGHSRTTVDRTLARLCEAGWVSQEGRPKRFTPSLRVALLGLAMLRQHRAHELALRYARELAQGARTSVAIGFYDHGEVVYTDQVELRGEHFVHNLFGFSLPAPSTASGRILLAYQAEEEIERVARCTPPEQLPSDFCSADAFIAEIRTCRERGYALLTYHDQQTATLAVPVLDQSGRGVFALGLSFLLPLDEAAVSRLAPLARMTAIRATSELQNHPHLGHLIA
jgi:DNA-binding IclR family transcriptional regulator